MLSPRKNNRKTYLAIAMSRYYLNLRHTVFHQKKITSNYKRQLFFTRHQEKKKKMLPIKLS